MDGSAIWPDATYKDCGWTIHFGAFKVYFGKANGPKMKKQKSIFRQNPRVFRCFQQSLKIYPIWWELMWNLSDTSDRISKSSETQPTANQGNER